MENNIETQRTFTNKQVWGIVLFAVTCAVYITLVFAEFVQVKQDLKILEQRLDKKINIQNENTNEINKLKQKGSDK